MSAVLPTKPPVPALITVKTMGLVAALVALLAIVWMPAAPGLPPAGQVMLAVLAFAVIVWMTQALDYAVSAVVIAALMVFLLAFVPGAPFSALLSVALYFIMTRMMKPEMAEIEGGQATIRAQLVSIGKMSANEWKLLTIVLVLLAFWASEKWLHNFDTASTTLAAIALMLLPRVGVMDWKASQRGFPWGTVVLFAIGISVGTALLRTGAAPWLANVIVQNLGLQSASAFVILMLLSLFLIVIHLPVNAPQNMIAYGTDTFDAKDFIRTGLVITAAAMALLVIFALTYWPWMGYMTKVV